MYMYMYIVQMYLCMQTECSRVVIREGQEELVQGQLHQTKQLAIVKQLII